MAIAWQGHAGNLQIAANCRLHQAAGPASGSIPKSVDVLSARKETVAVHLSLLEGSAWARIRFTLDLMVLAAACAVALVFGGSINSDWLLVLFPPMAIVLLHSRGRYRPRLRDVALDSIVSGFGAISVSTMTFLALKVAVSGDERSLIGVTARLWIAAIVGVTAVGLVLTVIQHLARSRGLSSSPTLIVGTDATGLAIAGRLRAHAEYGLRVIGFLDAATKTTPASEPPVLGTIDELSAVVAAHGIRHVIVCFPEASESALLSLIGACYERGIETNVVPRLMPSINHDTRFEYLGTTPLLNLRATDLEGRRFALKYSIDRVAAAVLLMILSPLMGAVALAVRLTSHGPVLFRQRRTGYDGRIFTLLKFRTMLETDDGAPFKPALGLAPGGVEGSDRRTPMGRFLRRTAIDELPQLINVVRGDMSLVGPRPERPEFAEMFCTQFERYHDRHRVRSGMTGWAQVNGYRGQTSLADRVEYDNFYIEHWSLSLDLKILLLTMPAVGKALLRGEIGSVSPRTAYLRQDVALTVDAKAPIGPFVELALHAHPAFAGQVGKQASGHGAAPAQSVTPPGVMNQRDAAGS
jgi:Undecaprenyl-phosphate glucose phosphotransferase